MKERNLVFCRKKNVFFFDQITWFLDQETWFIKNPAFWFSIWKTWFIKIDKQGFWKTCFLIEKSGFSTEKLGLSKTLLFESINQAFRFEKPSFSKPSFFFEKLSFSIVYRKTRFIKNSVFWIDKPGSRLIKFDKQIFDKPVFFFDWKTRFLDQETKFFKQLGFLDQKTIFFFESKNQVYRSKNLVYWWKTRFLSFIVHLTCHKRHSVLLSIFSQDNLQLPSSRVTTTWITEAWEKMVSVDSQYSLFYTSANSLKHNLTVKRI